jgi:hypothetical protein
MDKVQHKARMIGLYTYMKTNTQILKPQLLKPDESCQNFNQILYDILRQEKVLAEERKHDLGQMHV